MPEYEDLEIPEQYGNQQQPFIPPEQLFGSEVYQHKTRLYTTDAIERLRHRNNESFSLRLATAFTSGYDELFDRSHILAKMDDTEMTQIECELMHDRMKFAARKSDRNNRLFDVQFHGGIHLFNDVVTRAKGGWEADHQHKVSVESSQIQEIRHTMPKQKRGFLGLPFGGKK